MFPSSLITDNVAELLVKIMEFTQARQKLLCRNINNVRSGDFVPLDLNVDEFAGLMVNAINEHVHHRRLVLYDGDSVKFGPNGSFELKPVVDEQAGQLLEEDQDKYLELQIDKLLENALNQRVAAELLRHKQGMVPMFE